MIYLLLSFTILTDTLPNNVSLWCVQNRNLSIINFSLDFDYEMKNMRDIGYMELIKNILMKKFPQFEIATYAQHFVLSFNLKSTNIENLKKIFQQIFSIKITDKEYKLALKELNKEKIFHRYTLKDILVQTAFTKSAYGFSPYDFESFDKDVLLRVFDNILSHSFLTITISGGINPCDVVNEITHIFKKRKIVNNPRHPAYIQKSERIVLLNKREQNTLYLGVHIPFVSTKDFYGFYMFFASMPEANFIPHPPFLIIKYIISDTSDWENTLKSALQELNSRLDTIEKINLNRLKEKIIADFYLKNAPFPGFKTFFQNYSITPEQWRHNIKDIEFQDIKDAVQKYFVKDNFTIVVGEEK